MPLETALFFETAEQIYARVFRAVRPRTALPEIRVTFRSFANANSRIRLAEGMLAVDITDLLQAAPAPVQEALATILISKLFRKHPDRNSLALYRKYLNRSDVRRNLHRIKQERGHKQVLPPNGAAYDLCQIFEDLNFQYFHGLMARPQLGWSVRRSRTTLGHYDPSHHTIVLSRMLDSQAAPLRLVEYIMYHEMLHLRFPAEHRGPRRCVHTQAFKQAERQFEGFAEAQLDLKKFLAASTEH